MSDGRSHLVRGVGRLAVDATIGVTDIVEAMHADIAPGLTRSGERGSRRSGGIAGLVYRTIRGVSRGAGAGVDFALATLGDRLWQMAPSP